MTSKEVQYALTYGVGSPFDFRSHIVIPNIRDPTIGFTHELDLLSISIKTHIGTEIEIKASKADLKRDLEKSISIMTQELGRFILLEGWSCTMRFLNTFLHTLE